MPACFCNHLLVFLPHYHTGGITKAFALFIMHTTYLVLHLLVVSDHRTYRVCLMQSFIVATVLVAWQHADESFGSRGVVWHR